MRLGFNRRLISVTIPPPKAVALPRALHSPPLYSPSMKNLAILLLLAASAFAAPPKAAAPKPGTDQFAIESTVLAVYNVISGPAGRRDWDRFEALFAPGARLISTKRKDGAVTANVMTPQEYKEKASAYFADHGFFERP